MPAASAARSPSNDASTCWAPADRLPGQLAPDPCPRTSVQPTTCTGARRTIRRVRSRTASRETTQSRRPGPLDRDVHHDGRAGGGRQLHPDAEQLADAAAAPGCAARTGAGSPTRWTARRRATPGCPTRSIGTKIGRRVGSSTTRPSTRGGLRSSRSATTMSRTLPIDSPLGPNTGSPASCATKTRVGGGTGIRLGRAAAIRARARTPRGPGGLAAPGRLPSDRPGAHTSTRTARVRRVAGCRRMRRGPADGPAAWRRLRSESARRPEDSHDAPARRLPLCRVVPLIVLAACSSGPATASTHRPAPARSAPAATLGPAVPPATAVAAPVPADQLPTATRRVRREADHHVPGRRRRCRACSG